VRAQVHHAGVFILVISTFFAGCTSIPDQAESEGLVPKGDGWTYIGTEEQVDISLGNLGEDDWILYEIFHTDHPPWPIVALVDGMWDFPGFDVAPSLTHACVLLAMGNQNEALFATDPFLVPERFDPGPIAIGPQPKVQANHGDLGLDTSLRTTGFGFSLGDMLRIGGEKGNTSFLAYGLDQHEAWSQQGTEFSMIVGDDSAFYYREVHRGQMDCRASLSDYDEGEYVRTSEYTRVSGLKATFEAKHGAVIYLSYASHFEHEVRVTDPEGDLVFSNRSDQPDLGATFAPSHEVVVVCSDVPGDWIVEYPVLEGTDDRGVWAETLFLDVHPEFHMVFPCMEPIPS
jgi:hypothetical protein